MQTSSKPDDEYIPQDDESEAARVADLSGTGEVEYYTTEEIKDYSLLDYGIRGV